MEYKLFDEFITLQSLLKDLSIIHSGGAVKAFLAQTPVYLNDELEGRRGKKLRVGDVIHIPSLDTSITIVSPSEKEWTVHQEEQEEKERRAAFVRNLNQPAKQKTAAANKGKKGASNPRFPGM